MLLTLNNITRYYFLIGVNQKFFSFGCFLLVFVIGYVAILTLGEQHYGELTIKIGERYGYIDLTSFSAKINERRTKTFVKALKNYDYISVEHLILQNYNSILNNENMEISEEVEKEQKDKIK